MKNKDSSVLEYYQEREFNPVPIPVETKEAWEIQRKKRINLLQNHLRIPTNFFKNKHIIEFGCNSGENTLVFADLGAYLTLVEPNEQVIPRLESNFKTMNLYNQIQELSVTSIEDYSPKNHFDLVIAEGFLNTMPNKNKLLEKLLGMCNDGGGVIINYDDRYGGYLELLKSCVLKKVCYLKGVGLRSESSLELAKILFHKSFDKLNVSRPFDAWWEDQLVNPFASCIWSLDEIIQIAERQNFFCYSNSPVLPNPNLFQWYKDVNDIASINSKIMNVWLSSFPYILSGKNDMWRSFVPAEKKVIKAVFDHTTNMADYIADDNLEKFNLYFPSEMRKFFDSQSSRYFHTLADELENLYTVFNKGSFQEIINQYKNLNTLQDSWGTLLHYVCLMKN